MHNYSMPQINKPAFHCPHCGTYSHMDWNLIELDEKRFMSYKVAICSFCQKPSFWKVLDADFEIGSHFLQREFLYSKGNQTVTKTNGEMIYPDFGLAPLPETDMPDDVRKDYEEAAKIFSQSPRGAAALLRLALQKLCRHLGEEGKNINTDIRKLVERGVFSGQVVEVADTLRIAGNNAVHPAQISDEDFDEVAGKMFDLINFIVKKQLQSQKNYMPYTTRCLKTLVKRQSNRMQNH
ncbi:MAG: DUF4145 domain-containing protein [Neisseria animaloris]|nr:DUF4145 domain-containing protein [Neisseria animaloris]